MQNSRNLILMLFGFIQLSTTLILFTQEPENIWYKRERYFFIQRGSPYDSVPAYALNDALNEKLSMGPGGYYLTGINWSNIGPAPIDRGHWNGSGRYNSGRINSVSYLDDNTVYIGAAEGGVWKTINYSISGTDWLNMSAELKSLSTGALTVDNSNPNQPTIYYATGEGNYSFVYSYVGLGMFKSTNGGLNGRIFTKIQDFQQKIPDILSL